MIALPHPPWEFRRRASTYGRSASPPGPFAGAQVGAPHSGAHPFTPSTRFTWWCVPGAGKSVRSRGGGAPYSCPPAKLLRKHGQTTPLCRLPLAPHRRIGRMSEGGWPMDPVLWQRMRWDPDRVSQVRLDRVWMAGCASTLPADPLCHERHGASRPDGDLRPVPQEDSH